MRRYLADEAEATALVDGWIAAAAWPFRRRLAAEWDDVLQEIRLEIVGLLQRGSFRGDSRLRTYLWQVAGHTCLDALRRRQRRSFVGLEAVAETPTAAPSPFDQLSGREWRQAALRALGTLSPDCRDLWQRLLRGASYRELAVGLGVSEGALRVRAHRCRKAALDAYRAAVGRAMPEDESAVS